MSATPMRWQTIIRVAGTDQAVVWRVGFDGNREDFPGCVELRASSADQPVQGVLRADQDGPTGGGTAAARRGDQRIGTSPQTPVAGSID